MNLRRLRDELKKLRQAVEGDGGRQIVVVGNEQEAAEARRRLGPNADALVIITGISRPLQ